MKINSIILENFRNYKNLELDFDDSRNIIVGENAQGKTNLIEAIYLTAFARSFRTNNSAELVMFGEDSGRVSTDITSEDIEKNINIVIRSDGKKMIKKDGKAIRKTTELLNNVVVIIFSPDDLRIIKDSPEKRRTFINRELSQMRPRYYEVFRRYSDALRQKNAILKGYFNIKKKTFTRADNLSLNDISPYDNSRQYNVEMLDVFDRQLADNGYEIIRYRKEFAEMLSQEAGEIMNKISGGREELRIEYKTSCDFITGTEGRDILYKQFYHNREKDIYNGYATLGPHRDDIEFYINGKDAKKYGSQGQQRTIALSLKLAEIRIARQILDESPVLLLDDVLSELDLDRQRFLVSEIDDVQLFITSAELNEDVIKDLRGGTLFRVENGTITRVDKY
ncbi:MAG: DNA replication/repair protein RecF [Mogibacterium sp.]|nr:DNA replication/repair protein RecF [Mogibacterium sp.]MBR2539969.1 DNA replication/repair protein RecF [Mogibacterium sp.]